MWSTGIDSTVLVANSIEALLATGEWDEADRASAAAFRAITANFPYMLLMLRADLELGRGDFGAARAHLQAALATLREDRGQGIYDVYLAELALWECRWTEADQAVRAGEAQPASWSEATAAWERLERPPLAAYCRWRQAEALVATGASRIEASGPLREAHAVAAQIGAKPLLRELELLAERARLELALPQGEAPKARQRRRRPSA